MANPPSNCILIIDSRESLVSRHSAELSSINYEIKQITIGDYIIITPTGYIAAIIERKSLPDFAASIKDGRHLNKSNLLDTRRKCGCSIIYIVEGPLCPAQDQLFSGIKYASIESSIFHLMVRDNITVLRTTDTTDTASTLARFVKSMDTLDNLPDLKDELPPQPNSLSPEELSALITKRRTKSDIDIIHQMWACFPGITTTSAHSYSTKWSLFDLLSGAISVAEISSHHLPSGRKISKKVITSLTNPSKITQIKILASIPLITAPTATILLHSSTLGQLLVEPLDNIANRIINSKNKQLGPARASSIIKYLTFPNCPQL